MKTQSANQSAFLDPRAILALTFAFAGSFLAFAGLEENFDSRKPVFGFGSHVTTAAPGFREVVQDRVDRFTQDALAKSAPPTRSTFMATWTNVEGASGYRLDVSPDDRFVTFVQGYDDLDVGNVTGRVVTGLTKGASYYYRVRAYSPAGIGNNSVTMTGATAAGAGLIINPTFDSSITGNGNAAAIQAAITQAINIEEALFSNAITINIAFRWTTAADPCGTIGSSFLGRSCWTYSDQSWSTVINALKSHATTTNDGTANSSLPSSALSTYIRISTANGRALGLNTPGGLGYNGGTYDATITLNSTASFQFSRPTGSSSYDVVRTIEHEIDEVMGLGSAVNWTTNYRPQDLFAWSAAGVRNFTSSGSRYLSINSGATNLVGFNQSSGGDYGDWISPGCPQPNPYVQNAFSCPGQYSDVTATSPEGINLDVIGYNLVSNTSSGPATMTSPTPGSTFTSSTVTFSWSSSGSATQYFLYLGSSAGANDIYNATQGLNTSATVSGIPTDGRTIYVRLWSYINGTTWQYNDYTYRAYSGVSQSPPTATTTSATNVSNSQATMNGTVDPHGATTSAYFQFGTTTNYGSSSTAQTITSISSMATVLGNLAANTTYHYRIVASNSGGTSYGGDISFTTSSNTQAQMISPPPGAFFTSSNVTFSWSSVSGAAEYFLYVGSSAGGSDIYKLSQGLTTSVLVTSIPTDGRTIYVRLWTRIGTAWRYIDYTYTAAIVTSQPPIVTTIAATNVLSNTATLNATVNPNGSATTAYFQYGTTTSYLSGQTSPQTVTSTRSVSDTVTGGINPGTTYHYRIVAYNSSGTSYGADLTFTTPASTGAPGQLSTPSSDVTFNWTAGTNVTQYSLAVGSSPGGSDIISLSGLTSRTATISGMPIDGRILYVTLGSLVNGTWQYTTSTYTAFSNTTSASSAPK